MFAHSCIPIPSVFTMPYHSLLEEEPVIEQMAPLSRFEVSGPKLLESDQETSALFEKIGWKPFFFEFSVHNVDVARRFAFSFNGNIIQVGDLQFTVDEEFISRAAKLPHSRERWFKGSKVDRRKFKHFLLPLSKKHAHLQFGFLVKYLKDQWQTPFQIISRYPALSYSGMSHQVFQMAYISYEFDGVNRDIFAGR